jgi:hypothetical protein
MKHDKKTRGRPVTKPKAPPRPAPTKDLSEEDLDQVAGGVAVEGGIKGEYLKIKF